LPGLQDAFDIDGFISSDLKTITGDEFIYKRRPGRGGGGDGWTRGLERGDTGRTRTDHDNVP
jgi:hypothetical protein